MTRERVLLLGGAAAAILQTAHPEVALGVAAHSDFRRDTLGRLHRTLDAVYTITFSPRNEVEAMAGRVRARHATVRGDSPQRYSAFSLDAQMWVVATLVQLSVEMFERFVGTVTDSEREAFYRDMRVFGVHFGLPASFGPQNWAEFSRYYREMLEGGLLGSLPVSRELARHIAHPGKPGYLRVLWPLSGSVAREFLPFPLCEVLDLPRTQTSRITVAILDAILPGFLPWLPGPLRYAREYRRAIRKT